MKDAAKTKKLEEIVAESFEEHHFVNLVVAEIKAELEDLGAQMEELKTQLMESPQEQPASWPSGWQDLQ